MNDKNQNTNAQKRLLEKIKRAEETFNENIMVTEEKISSQKNEVRNMSSQLDNKIRELTSHSQELAQLSNTLNEYRSMLAVLEVSTNKTHEWVITVRNDCKKSEEIQKVIEAHQNTTIDILDTFKDAVEKQDNFYGEYQAKLEQLKRSYINEINEYVKVASENINSKIISINQASKTTSKTIEEAKNTFDNLSNEGIRFVNESKKMLEDYKKESAIEMEKAKAIISEEIKNSIKLHKNSIAKADEEYLVKYAKEIETINLSKMEEADDALNKLVDSIKTLKDIEKNDTNDIKKKDIILEKGESVNTSSKIEDKEINLVENRESEKVEEKQKTIKKDDKIFYPIGEEEEILLD